jgi:hypothetical protein
LHQDFSELIQLVLVCHARADAVAVRRLTGAGEQALVRRRKHRQPVVARIDARGFLRRLRGDRVQRHGVRAGFSVTFANRRGRSRAPTRCSSRWQLGQQEPALIVGDDDLDEVGREVLGFGNHPDTGLRTLVAAHHAGDHAVGGRGGVLRLERLPVETTNAVVRAISPAVRTANPTRERVDVLTDSSC